MSDLAGSRLGLEFSWYSVRLSTVIIQFTGRLGSPSAFFCSNDYFTPSRQVLWSFSPTLDYTIPLSHSQKPWNTKYGLSYEILKVLADFRSESICRLSWKVFADFGGNNAGISLESPYLVFQSLHSHFEKESFGYI